jgi:hypothetical protein
MYIGNRYVGSRNVSARFQNPYRFCNDRNKRMYEWMLGIEYTMVLKESCQSSCDLVYTARAHVPRFKTFHTQTRKYHETEGNTLCANLNLADLACVYILTVYRVRKS